MVETLAVEWGPYGIQVNGLVPGLFPHEDMTADIKGNLDRTNEKDRCQPALRVGRLRELGWAATFLASPYARFISGHTLVVDGANWQRRTSPTRRSSPSATRWAREVSTALGARVAWSSAAGFPLCLVTTFMSGACGGGGGGEQGGGVRR